ncbi:MAG TPA: GGDEF domain-containing protein [Kofleriaceae bacterium]|nr:GGDEF domain-containing protein [Kofleriaceae bacterium]
MRISLAVIGGLAGATLATAVLVIGRGASLPVLVAAVAGLSALFGFTLGRSQDRLLASSLTEPLTGLANRRCFEGRLHELVASASRHNFPVALLLIDVDRLKQVNDRLGHRGGDAALRQVARCLTAACRSTDLVARIGGDEFAVLAPFTDVRRALEIAERIRRDLPAEVNIGPDACPLTVSIGIADRRGLVIDAAELVESADKALYAAKDGGRDRIELSPSRVLTQRLYNIDHQPAA